MTAWRGRLCQGHLVKTGVTVAYGEGEGGVMEFTEDRELCRFNEDVFRQSQAIAGRSDKLIASLAGVAIGKAGTRRRDTK